MHSVPKWLNLAGGVGGELEEKGTGGKKDTVYISIDKDAAWACLPPNKRAWLYHRLSSWNNQKYWTLETGSPLIFSCFHCCCRNREMARELRLGNSTEVKGIYWFFALLGYLNESPLNCRSPSMLHSQDIASGTLGLAQSHERSRAITVMMELETICTSTMGRVEIVKGRRREWLSFKRAWWPCRVRDEVKIAIEDAWRPGGKVSVVTP